MLNPPIAISEANFYITNFCNLSCDNCITFSNLNFIGHYEWSDYESKNKLWPIYITPRKVTLIGGEPFTNPDILNWVYGIRSLWPDHDNMSVTTNGTFFNKKRYREIAKHIIKSKIRLEVSVHSAKDYDRILNDLLSILKEVGIEYRCIDITVDMNDREYDLAEGMTQEDLEKSNDEKKFVHKYEGHTLFTISKKYIFQSNTITFIDKKNIKMNQNDPITSHSKCCLIDFHFIYKGDLYKCHVPSVGQDFMNQFVLEERSAELIKKYKPCDPTDDPGNIMNFLKNILNPIEQCSLCPSRLNLHIALP